MDTESTAVGVAQDVQLSPLGQQIEKLTKMSRRPEFIPRFLDAAAKAETSWVWKRRAKYWLHRCMGIRA